MRNHPGQQPSRGLRSDAVRNQGQLLAAAREVFVERGPRAPLDEIARRAGVGIGTLYRRFPDRHALMRAVVLDALAQTKQAAELAFVEEPNGFAALTRYMHAVIDIGVAAVIPALMDELELDDAQLRPASDASARAIQDIIDKAHDDGTLPHEVTFGDIGTLLVRLSRPLPGPVSAELNTRLAHRHVDLLIEGLRPTAGRHEVVEGPALSRRDLRAIRERAATAEDASESGSA